MTVNNGAGINRHFEGNRSSDAALLAGTSLTSELKQSRRKGYSYRNRRMALPPYFRFTGFDQQASPIADNLGEYLFDPYSCSPHA
jgi:hypothetical protein